MSAAYREKDIKKHGLTVAEFLVGLSVLEDVDLHEGIKSLQNKGVLDYFNGRLFIMPQLRHKIEAIILDASAEQINDDRLTKLVENMRELFPTGKKDGTTYYWRGNTSEIKHKLRIFFKRYGDFEDDVILDATKRYVESFYGQYRFMHLLKYFIIKNVKDAAGDVNEQSELFAFIENADQKDHNVDMQSIII